MVMEHERKSTVHHEERTQAQDMAVTAIAALIILLTLVFVALLS
jgi:hypothetical protein